MLMDMCLLEFDIYQGTIAPNFNATQRRYFFQKEVSFDVWSEIHLV